MSLLRSVQILVLCDAFVNAIKGIGRSLIKSADNINLRAVANIPENRIKIENYHDKSAEWSETKNIVSLKQDTQAEILSPYTKWQVKKKIFGKHSPWKVS